MNQITFAEALLFIFFGTFEPQIVLMLLLFYGEFGRFGVVLGLYPNLINSEVNLI